jgi:hypothetical protein
MQELRADRLVRTENGKVIFEDSQAAASGGVQPNLPAHKDAGRVYAASMLNVFAWMGSPRSPWCG